MRKQGFIRINVAREKAVFAYSLANGKVFAALSNGQLFRFDGGRWCEILQKEMVFRCGEGEKIEGSSQFYTFIFWRGRTRVGHYPSGKLFEFDGDEMRPSRITPDRLNFGAAWSNEAQSLAVYCGDLYVGLWPRGLLFRHDGKHWHDAIRLFDAPRAKKGTLSRTLPAGKV